MKKVTEVKTIEEGFNKKTSFVVRGLKLPCNLQICKKRALMKDVDLFGYVKKGDAVYVKASKALLNYERDTLSMNIVDAPFPVLLDNELPPVLLNYIKKSGQAICITLTRKDSYTPLHVDPPSGGGWMYLQEGVKKWQLIEPEFIEQFVAAGKTINDDLTDPPKDYDAAIISETIITAGDFLYFAPMTPHRVWTYEKSFGVSGYAKVI